MLQRKRCDLSTAGDAAWTVENKEESVSSAPAAPHRTKSEPRKNNVQTKT